MFGKLLSPEACRVAEFPTFNGKMQQFVNCCRRKPATWPTSRLERKEEHISCSVLPPKWGYPLRERGSTQKAQKQNVWMELCIMENISGVQEISFSLLQNTKLSQQIQTYIFIGFPSFLVFPLFPDVGRWHWCSPFQSFAHISSPRTSLWPPLHTQAQVRIHTHTAAPSFPRLQLLCGAIDSIIKSCGTKQLNSMDAWRTIIFENLSQIWDIDIYTGLEWCHRVR